MKAYALLVLSCIGYAFGPPAYMKIYETGLSPDIIVGYFLLFGGGGLMIARHVGQKPRSVRYGPILVLLIIVVGVMWPLYFLGYIQAMMQSSIAEATLIARLTPLMVVILSIWLLSDKVTSWSGVFLSIILCVIGVMVVQPNTVLSEMNFEFFTPAVMIMLTTCFIGALSEVLRASMSKGMDPSDIIAKSMVIGGVSVFCFQAFEGREILVPNIEQMFYLFLLGMVTVAVPAQLKIHAFKMIGSQGKVSFAAYLIPILTVIIAYFWNGDRFNFLYFGIGFMFIIGGVIIAQRSIVSPKK